MSQVIVEPEPVVIAPRPICVDLDGTLVKSDTLIDSLLVLARTRPRLIPALFAQVLRGRAAFKAFVTDNVRLDVKHLPYNRKLLQYLNGERREGRPIYLATGADVRLARRVAEHLGIFAGVLGSDGNINFTGSKKLAGLRSTLGTTTFDYIGNDTPDLPLLADAAQAMVANPSRRLRSRLRARNIVPARVFEERSSFIRSAIKALRPHQWAKNALIPLPLLLAHSINPAFYFSAAVAIVTFSFAASAAYIMNDLLDIEADRRHPQKRLRPFASGELSAQSGIALVCSLLLLAFLGAHLLPAEFFGWLLLYLATTAAYSLYFKRLAIVDVLVLSGLYTLRLLAGAAATDTHISPWLAGFSVFLFLSLAIVKRFAELENLATRGAPPSNGRGYLITDLNQMRSFGTASAFAAVVVFTNYISSHEVAMLYKHADRLWVIMPFMILWLCRVWLLASRGLLNEDPMVFALTDRQSLIIGAAVIALVLLAI
ncbi:MAG TPA: UbiA family prenyltransferase [Terracidiphilus sp.]|nr:UbiA family prenyltransferase [Terracidiphilus sp.]